MTGSPAAGPLLRFGRAELDNQELRIDGQRVSLGPRAFGLLRALVDQRQRALSKHELLDTVWRGVIVEENNLQVQISTLRRLLGPQAIATIPGRGYRFVLPVEGDPATAEAAPRTDTEPAATAGWRSGNLARHPPPLVGRDADCERVRALLAEHALVTIVGAPGIGKTRLALAAAAAQAGRYAGGAWFVELAALHDPRLLVQTFAQALRVVLPGLRAPLEELGAALREQQALLVIDNCEHLLDDVGELIEHLLRHVGTLRILATSQEPLKLGEEHQFRVAPLPVPASAQTPDAAEYGALRLFAERARAQLPQFVLTDANIADAIEICHRLDGLPLAIELAAARVPVLGVAGVRERLGERLRVLTGGSRIAPKRHQTLRAALDWSHALLDEPERAVYRRLGAFVGSFSLESAQDLASGGRIDGWAVLECLSSLIDKSLVNATAEPRPRYQLLESAREHALEQLAQAGETDEWLARHAAVTRQALERAIRARRTDWVVAEMDNVRISYDWARNHGHDAALAVALATLPAMAIAVGGAVQEARQRLLDVEPLIDETLPTALAAQYWQWYGRIGLDGRLPSSRCIDALRRAENLFTELGKVRHVHACRRHLTEALIDAGDLDGAAKTLAGARALENPGWPLADRMRELRVEGLLLARSGCGDDALRAATAALQMAQVGEIDRYELVLLDDIARIHMEAGRAGEAAERYRALAERARRAEHGGLTLSNALAGLVAALLAEGDLAGAGAVASEAVPVLGRCGILAARADILAHLMVRQGRYEAAGRLIGASDRFRGSCETPRDPVEQRSREQALARLAAVADAPTLARWMAAGAAAGEDELLLGCG